MLEDEPVRSARALSAVGLLAGALMVAWPAGMFAGVMLLLLLLGDFTASLAVLRASLIAARA